MKRSDKITLLVMLAVIVLAGLFTWYIRSNSSANQPYGSLSVAEQAFIGTQYESLTGEPVTLADFAGDVIVVNAWASWCPFCVAELPDLATLADIYKDQDVRVVAINRAEPPTTAVSYLKSVNVSTTGSLNLWLDPDDNFYKGIGGFTMPETIVYNRDGTVDRHKRGFMKLEEMQQFVNEALQAE